MEHLSAALAPSLVPQTGKTCRTGKRIRLAGGVTGYYTEGACGAGCQDSVISWSVGPNEYTAGIKGGSEADATARANAVLRH